MLVLYSRFAYLCTIKLNKLYNKSINAMEKVIPKPMLAVLRDMKVGEACVYPVSRMSSLKTMCSTYGVQWGRKFTTKVNTTERTITATRVR